MCFIIMLTKGSKAYVIDQLRISAARGIADFVCIEQEVGFGAAAVVGNGVCCWVMVG